MDRGIHLLYPMHNIVLCLFYTLLFIMINQIGYRDGLMAGKEASAQEGFNIGFGESVFVGYKWGLVRGVTR